MENAVTETDRLSGIDENVCILHGNIWYMVLGIDKKYETLSIYPPYMRVSSPINKTVTGLVNIPLVEINSTFF